MEILTSILHYFSSHLLDTCREGPEDDSVGPHNVRWVINLPSKSRNNIVDLLTVAATKVFLQQVSVCTIWGFLHLSVTVLFLKERPMGHNAHLRNHFLEVHKLEQSMINYQYIGYKHSVSSLVGKRMIFSF